MDAKRRTTASKLLSKVLRHDPTCVGVTLDEAGWVDVDALLPALARAGAPLSEAELAEIVSTSDKQRFRLEDRRIRANQGHSVDVDLGLAPVAPPDVLFHGTVAEALPGIRADGLQRRSRQHVHLSKDEATAVRVGSRRGTAVILAVDAKAAHAAGVAFYVSENGVWLADAVPAAFVRFPS